MWNDWVLCIGGNAHRESKMIRRELASRQIIRLFDDRARMKGHGQKRLNSVGFLPEQLVDVTSGAGCGQLDAFADLGAKPSSEVLNGMAGEILF